MAERITNTQFANRCHWATRSGRMAGALREGEWIGTAVAWSMSYVCIYDTNGRMVRHLSNPMTKRGLFDYVGALADGFDLVVQVSVPVEIANARAGLTADGFTR